MNRWGCLKASVVIQEAAMCLRTYLKIISLSCRFIEAKRLYDISLYVNYWEMVITETQDMVGSSRPKQRKGTFSGGGYISALASCFFFE
jgi:hypothetical protein